jgi:hypothetical protein
MGFARLLAAAVAILFMIALLWILIAGSTISFAEEICSAKYPPGTEITLTAAPCPDSNFIKWTGDFCSGSKLTTCTFKMPDKDVKINAEFRKKPMKPTWRKGM